METPGRMQLHCMTDSRLGEVTALSAAILHRQVTVHFGHTCATWIQSTSTPHFFEIHCTIIIFQRISSGLSNFTGFSGRILCETICSMRATWPVHLILRVFTKKATHLSMCLSLGPQRGRFSSLHGTSDLLGKVKVKGKVFPVHAMRVYRGSRGIAPTILNLGTRWRWVVNFTPRPLYSWERTPVPIEQKAG
jgi:hypothetical protein